MKILHSADWHLDTAFVGRTPEQVKFLRAELLQIPDKVCALCKSEGCDLMLLAGDLFDGAHTQESYRAIYRALAEVGIPVFIAPGNHDFCQPGSPYLKENWPDNVHIFMHPVMESVSLPQLNCKIYGAGYETMDCPALLKGFNAEGEEKYHIGILHSDPLQLSSPYAPLTKQQVRQSKLDYLALGHIHMCGEFQEGKTLCAWPGCPMGRGYDESGTKGVYITTLENSASVEFIPMNTTRFYDLSVDAGDNAATAVENAVPAAATQDIYRITLTGYSAPLDLNTIAKALPHVPNLELRDRTIPEMDLWSNIDEDTLEGHYFRLLHDGLDTDSEKLKQNLKLAAKISRQILDGQEVALP